jgi:uncharacterized PurR-regulated membrane protein YhhQ (DUF165 family)
VYATIFLIGCIGFTVFNYRQLSKGEGWGVVLMVGLFGLGLLLLVVDIVLHNIFKNRTAANIIGLIIAIVFTLWLVYGRAFS